MLICRNFNEVVLKKKNIDFMLRFNTILPHRFQFIPHIIMKNTFVISEE